MAYTIIECRGIRTIERIPHTMGRAVDGSRVTVTVRVTAPGTIGSALTRQASRVRGVSSSERHAASLSLPRV